MPSLESAAIGRRGDTETPFECPTKRICATEADRVGNNPNRVVAGREPLAGLVETHVLNELGWR
jgi:hypothetical protein